MSTPDKFETNINELKNLFENMDTNLSRVLQEFDENYSDLGGESEGVRAKIEEIYSKLDTIQNNAQNVLNYFNTRSNQEEVNLGNVRGEPESSYEEFRNDDRRHNI